MAQSSNYKQYQRTTRTLTEESGFAGGMLWTGNNIDASHLKAVVNFDYDETTGYLKTRDPFKSVNAGFKDWFATQFSEDTNMSLLDKTFIGAYNICPVDKANGEKLLDAGWLYVFADCTQEELCRLYDLQNTATMVYVDAEGSAHNCVIDTQVCTLCNSKRNQLLTLYDNQLYGYGVYDDIPEAFIQVYRLERIEESYCFKQFDYHEYVQPRINSVTLLEASVTGFNAAKGSNTFTYEATALDDTDSATPSILGVYLTDEKNNVVVSPRIDHTYTINVVTAYTVLNDASKVHALGLFQLKDTGSSESTEAGDIWQRVSVSTAPNAGVHSFTFKFKKKETVFAFAYYDAVATSTQNYEVYADNVKDLLAPYTISASNSMDNVKLKNYDLSVANNHCLWNNRMCVWGTEDSNNCLFLSEVDNFYYYPIPHNVAIFDTNVISCIPYKDALLVFTADKIYKIVADKAGSFVQTVVQNDMPMTKADAAYLTAIKNMVLFKSGNYFYMVVPKTQSLTDELSIAPIYKNVAGFLNNLDKSTLEVLQLLYPERQFNKCTVKNNAPTAMYAEQDTIHLLYDVETNSTQKIFTDATETNVELTTTFNTFKLFLNYNTNLRAWTLYIEETTHSSLEPAALTTSRLMSFVRVSHDNVLDIVTQQYSEDVGDGIRVLLDSGYRSLSVALQKRFREVQLKLFSVTENITSFGTAFLVDGVWRRTYSKLEEFVQVDDTVLLTTAFDANTFITELTMPIKEDGTVDKSTGSDAIELADWNLDFSHFKREAPVSVRVPVSGKGFNPRFIFMAPNAVALTVNEVSWVYRLMYGR